MREGERERDDWVSLTRICSMTARDKENEGDEWLVSDKQVGRG